MASTEATTLAVNAIIEALKITCSGGRRLKLYAECEAAWAGITDDELHRITQKLVTSGENYGLTPNIANIVILKYRKTPTEIPAGISQRDHTMLAAKAEMRAFCNTDPRPTVEKAKAKRAKVAKRYNIKATEVPVPAWVLGLSLTDIVLPRRKVVGSTEANENSEQV